MQHYNISTFGLKEATECSCALRKMGHDCRAMEEAANKIVNFFYNSFADRENGPTDFALVRLFKAQSYGDLHEGLQSFAKGVFPEDVINVHTKCLTLLATTGDEPNWKSRRSSAGHKAIPLISEDSVNKVPMIKHLINQLGIDIKTYIQPSPKIIRDLSEKTFGVFLVSNAHGSASIPAQNGFVLPFQIKSVLGFGGLFPDGDLFTVIIFSKKFISEGAADLFKTISLAVKISLLPYTKEVFSDE